MQEEVNTAAAGTYETLYPDMYYKMQPFIVSACDQMDRYGYGVPTKARVQDTSDRIYVEMCRIHPEFAQYGSAQVQSAQRNRGLFRDFLDILLLNELFNRRRYY